MRANVNRALAFSGLAVDAAGQIYAVDRAQTLSEAQRRADELRADLTTRGVHPDVLRFLARRTGCRQLFSRGA